VAALALKQGGEPQSYCLPAASGAYRFWTLLANDNPLPNHAWQVSSLAFYQ
jgi:hypothetical protein